MYHLSSLLTLFISISSCINTTVAAAKLPTKRLTTSTSSSKLLTKCSSTILTLPSQTSRSSIKSTDPSVSFSTKSSVSASRSNPSESGSRSSSRPSQSSVSKSSDAGCPPYSPTTRTIIRTANVPTETIFTGDTITFSQTVPYTTIITTIPTIATVSTFEYSSTTTTVSTITTTSITVIPASTTITVPTVAGFTPLLCLPAYLDSTITTTTTIFEATTLPPSTFTTISDVYTSTILDYTSTFTETVFDSAVLTVTQSPVVTYTSTRADPTSSVYAACASNNLSPYGPANRYNNLAVNVASTTIVEVPAVDLVDCCAQCQADPACTVSLSYSRSPGTPLLCGKAIKGPSANSTCDPAFDAVRAGGRADSPNIYLSNSPCGRVTYGSTVNDLDL